MREPIRLATRTQAASSAIRAIFAKIPLLNQERAQLNLDPIINLSIGQPHLEPNPSVIENLKKDLESSSISFQYSPSQGREDTLQAIIDLYNHYYPKTHFSKEEVMVTNGGSQALWNAFSILIEKEDVVVTFEPYFSTYRGQIESLGGTLKVVSTLKNNFRPNPKVLDQMLESEPHAKMVIINYPNNPTGIALTQDEVTALAEVLKKYPNVAIVIDDVYRDLNYNSHFTILDVAPELKDRCIAINSGAKGLIGAPDLRVGMASANPEWIKAMSQQQLLAISGVPILTQKALIYAVKSHLQQKNWLNQIRSEYKSNLDFAITEFGKLGLAPIQKPEGAFYLFVSGKHLIGKIIPENLQEKLGTSTLRNDLDIVNYFMTVAGVATVPGSGFGVDSKEGFIRISCANNKETLALAATKIGESIQLLKSKRISILVSNIFAKSGAISLENSTGASLEPKSGS